MLCLGNDEFGLDILLLLIWFNVFSFFIPFLWAAFVVGGVSEIERFHHVAVAN